MDIDLSPKCIWPCAESPIEPPPLNDDHSRPTAASKSNDIRTAWDALDTAYHSKIQRIFGKFIDPDYSLEKNSYLENMVCLPETLQHLHDMQGTYRIRLTEGFGDQFLLHLTWDNDRIWGALDLGDLRLVLLIDEPPSGDYLRFPGEVCVFRWISTGTGMPGGGGVDTTTRCSAMNTGQIFFAPDRSLSGRVCNAMSLSCVGVDVPEIHFLGIRVADATRSPASHVAEWNAAHNNNNASDAWSQRRSVQVSCSPTVNNALVQHLGAHWNRASFFRNLQRPFRPSFLAPTSCSSSPSASNEPASGPIILKVDWENESVWGAFETTRFAVSMKISGLPDAGKASQKVLAKCRAVEKGRRKTSSGFALLNLYVYSGGAMHLRGDVMVADLEFYFQGQSVATVGGEVVEKGVEDYRRAWDKARRR
jgi:hypothetical protein